jgi:hypothetical protein
VPADRAAALRGELELDASPDGYAQPLGHIVAERLLAAPGERPAAPRRTVRRQTWLTFLAEASELLASPWT